MLPRPLLAVLALIATPLLAAPGRDVVREQQNFTVNGQKEVWRLIWRGTPSDRNRCDLTDPEGATTCPCEGFAYAQQGDLVLERERAGAAPERMPLTPLFAGPDMPMNENGPVALLPRWPALLHDIGHSPTPAAIRARPIVRIMRLRDYNHDGIAGEFLLQVDAPVCGKQVLVAVGTTRDNPHLHALTSAEHPERPLALYKGQWEALARNPRPGVVRDVPCGDHGAEENTTMLLRTDHGRIHATRITSTCPPDGTRDANGRWHHDDHYRQRVLSREVM
ncbi:MAG: hypothetical protein V4475_07080 [Pseudomonadota bacterium]